MKIIVCIKQVPGTTAVEVDEKSGVLKRDGVESKMNPYDFYSLHDFLEFSSLSPNYVNLNMNPLYLEMKTIN